MWLKGGQRATYDQYPSPHFSPLINVAAVVCILHSLWKSYLFGLQLPASIVFESRNPKKEEFSRLWGFLHAVYSKFNPSQFQIKLEKPLPPPPTRSYVRVRSILGHEVFQAGLWTQLRVWTWQAEFPEWKILGFGLQRGRKITTNDTSLVCC